MLFAPSTMRLVTASDEDVKTLLIFEEKNIMNTNTLKGHRYEMHPIGANPAPCSGTQVG
jgi:hypothetical protein